MGRSGVPAKVEFDPSVRLCRDGKATLDLSRPSIGAVAWAASISCLSACPGWNIARMWRPKLCHGSWIRSFCLTKHTVQDVAPAGGARKGKREIVFPISLPLPLGGRGGYRDSH